MPAGGEFPRGWALSSVGGGFTLTVPACPGLTHILTQVNATLTYNGSEQLGAIVLIESPAGTIILQPAIILSISSTAAGQQTSASGTWSGQLAGQPGEALEVGLANIGPATAYIDMAGYDI
jgi:hypothetical protein